MVSTTEQYHVERAGLTSGARKRVMDEIDRCLGIVARHASLTLPVPIISFDLTGRAAGQYRRTRRGLRYQHEIRFNPYLLARHLGDGLASTVPHEVAHYAVAMLCGGGQRTPHGAEWRHIMQVLGAAPDITHRHDLAGLPVRRQRRWRYRCACRDHELSTTRHNRVLRGAGYRCTLCRTPLVAVPTGG